MKKLLLLLLCLPLMTLAQQTYVPDDKFKKHDSYSLPNDAIDYEVYWNGSNYYPIGWSRNGNIAYLERATPGARGGCSDNLIIQSTISDKILKTIEIARAFEGEDEDWMEICDLERRWNKEKRLILKYLNEYEIEDNSFDQIIKSEEIRVRDNVYKIKLSQNLIEEYDLENDEGQNQTKYKLKVYLEGESKTISKNVLLAHNIDYLGYYKSPFERRVVIVLQYQDLKGGEWGHNGGIILIGCDLDSTYWDY